MYGFMGVFMNGTCSQEYYIIAKEKVSPLGQEFSYDYFKLLRDAMGNKKVSVKAFLATEQRIPGLGNGTLQDILWNAKLHPKCELNSVTEEEYWRMYTAVKGTLAEMCASGGRDTERDFLGNPGGYRTILSKKTLWTPCEHCQRA